MLLANTLRTMDFRLDSFNGHPPLGVNATVGGRPSAARAIDRFNGHPPLGVNATEKSSPWPRKCFRTFQWAPTLGGECYGAIKVLEDLLFELFQWAPTLGGECYPSQVARWMIWDIGFNGHPPLGVNATRPVLWLRSSSAVSMGTHPWG